MRFRSAGTRDSGQREMASRCGRLWIRGSWGNIKVSWRSKAMASAHPSQGLPSGMDLSMMDEYTSSPSCCKNSSRYPALARLGSSVPKMVGVDCGAIQPGGACFEPNMVRAHAAYAMNQLYQAAGSHPWNYDFR
ncbi:Glucan endo-1,3-beta-glucosidase 7 [Hordeum vulgare]|nr:Glucan endo-1,3-beta-glucosidase 7 [Hordeum vulgare]